MCQELFYSKEQEDKILGLRGACVLLEKQHGIDEDEKRKLEKEKKMFISDKGFDENKSG